MKTILYFYDNSFAHVRRRLAGIPWCAWNYLSTPNDGNRFSLVDDDARKILSPELLKACLGDL